MSENPVIDRLTKLLHRFDAENEAERLTAMRVFTHTVQTKGIDLQSLTLHSQTSEVIFTAAPREDR